MGENLVEDLLTKNVAEPAFEAGEVKKFLLTQESPLSLVESTLVV